jgi:hypothetical protein
VIFPDDVFVSWFFACRLGVCLIYSCLTSLSVFSRSERLIFFLHVLLLLCCCFSMPDVYSTFRGYPAQLLELSIYTYTHPSIYPVHPGMYISHLVCLLPCCVPIQILSHTYDYGKNTKAYMYGSITWKLGLDSHSIPCTAMFFFSLFVCMSTNRVNPSRWELSRYLHLSTARYVCWRAIAVL